MPAALSTLVLLLLSGAASRAQAFNSYPTPGSIHSQITDDACTGKISDRDLVSGLEEATRQPDWDESERDGLSYLPNDKYCYWHHFDRPPKLTNAQAFSDAQAYVKEQMDLVVSSAKKADWNGACWAVGRIFHVVQDFYSHSNYVDLSGADQSTCNNAVLDAGVGPPAGLKLTGFSRPAKEGDVPGLPPGDVYPHDKFCKDSESANDEAKAKIGNQTKYKLAKTAATIESARMLGIVQARLQALNKKVAVADTATLWDDFLACGERPSNFRDAYEWSCTQFLASGGSLGCFDTQLLLPGGALAAPESLTLLGVADSLGGMDMRITAADGATILRFRELQPDSLLFGLPVRATVPFDPAWLSLYLPDSVRAYVWEPDSEAWYRAQGTQMDLPTLTVSFLVDRAGTYGLGLIPTLLTTAVEVSSLDARARAGYVDLAWSSSLPAGTEFLVERAETGEPGNPGPGVFARLWGTSVLPGESGGSGFHFRDESVRAGAGYTYRLSYGKSGAWQVARTAAVRVPGYPFAIESLSPNPSRADTRIRFRIPTRGPVSVEILDIRGGRVRLVAEGMREAGTSNVNWDGRDDAGGPAPAGIYFVRISSGGAMHVRKLCRVG